MEQFRNLTWKKKFLISFPPPPKKNYVKKSYSVLAMSMPLYKEVEA